MTLSSGLARGQATSRHPSLTSCACRLTGSVANFGARCTISKMQATDTPIARPAATKGAAPSATATSAAETLPGALGARRGLGVLVVVSVMLLQGAADYVAGRGVGRFVFLLVELPVLMLALSTQYNWSTKRHMTAAQSLLSGMATATVLGCLFGLLYARVSEVVPDMQFHFPNGAVNIPRSALYGILSAQLYFGLWALAFVFPHAVESARVRRLEAQTLRSEAELAHLRAHLEPHFLLNTLNTIAGLVGEDPREARRLIVCLGDLLRDAVQDRNELQSLDRQLTWLRRYAEILEARHASILRFEWDIDAETSTEMLPRLLLQPLVENAVKHGALKRAGGNGKVVIRTERASDGALVCTVEDNGPGLGDSGTREGAFGVESVKKRLDLAAPGSTLTFDSSSEGTKAVVRVPPPKGP